MRAVFDHAILMTYSQYKSVVSQIAFAQQTSSPPVIGYQRVSPYPSSFGEKNLCGIRSKTPCAGSRGKFGCRGAGNTKLSHAGCFGGASSHREVPLPSSWVDPDPCPAVQPFLQRQAKKQLQREKNRFSPLSKMSDMSEPLPSASCARLRQNGRKVQKIVKFLGIDRSLKAVNPPPTNVPCGAIRSAVLSRYDVKQLTLADTLSIKTAAKAEANPCEFCENQQEHKMNLWKKERVRPCEVDEAHLDAFSKAFRSNVEHGWNRASAWMPYVPNGHATMNHTRCEGGNWNEEQFSDECSAVMVMSSGKGRIVNLYSGYNVEVLTPLHRALYGSIRRKGWLLVGSPTRERLLHLDQVAEGKQWLSFDYIGATDNIKTAYVRRAVEILIDRAEGLTVDEIRCLEVVANLKLFVGDDEHATPAFTGQPMGSPMSFPLLCLINKTVVDLALGSLLSRGAITVKEWRRHPCLINGDDLLTKDVSSGGLAEAIYANGGQVGLMTNPEKTLASAEIAEINSTVFVDCALQKKTNVSALWMGAEVQDVIGFAKEASRSKEGFMYLVRANAGRLAKAEQKIAGHIAYSWRRALIKDPVIRKALESRPSSRVPDDTNLFPVVAKPDGYDLNKWEEAAVIRQRVRAIRTSQDFLEAKSRKAKNSKRRKKVKGVHEGQRSVRGLAKLLKPNKPVEDQVTLKILASSWEKKRKEDLARADREVHVFNFSMHCSTSPFTVPTIKAHMGLSGIASMELMIKDFYNKRKVQSGPNLLTRRSSDTLPPSYMSISLESESQDKKDQIVPIKLGFGQPGCG